MSRMSEMSHAMQDYCNENYGPEDIPEPETKLECANANCSAVFYTPVGHTTSCCPECGSESFYKRSDDDDF